MITNMPAPDHLDELLCHLQCFYKDQRKKVISDSEPDTMSSCVLVFSHRFMARTLRAWAINRWKKTRYVNYNTDRKLG